MERALVGVFDDQYEAQQARDALLAEGFPNDHVRIASGDNAGTVPSTGETAEYDASFTGNARSKSRSIRGSSTASTSRASTSSATTRFGSNTRNWCSMPL
jgi:hypothetical protein